MQVLPHDVNKAMELLRADPARESSVDELAAACGVGRRTLEKHFRRFLGRTLVEVRRTCAWNELGANCCGLHRVPL